MVLFDRKENELLPLKYKVEDKIMGFHINIAGDMLVGGIIVEVKQSTSYLDDNEYKVKIEPELCSGDTDLFWWIDEKEAQPFKQDVWDRSVIHWKRHLELKKKSYLEYVRMHKSLRGLPDDMGDSELEKELEDRYKTKE